MYVLAYHIKQGNMGRACSMNKADEKSKLVVVWKPERKRLLERPRCRRKDNIEINFRKIGFGGMDCIHVTQ
jgi:hypothetical protein